jgi:hypothetical protein
MKANSKEQRVEKSVGRERGDRIGDLKTSGSGIKRRTSQLNSIELLSASIDVGFIAMLNSCVRQVYRFPTI